MRSAIASALVLACACGNLSNEDLAYLSALPRKDDLHVKVPADAAQPLCGPGTFGEADSWKQAKTTGDSLNAGVDGILALVELVRGVTPTQRTEDDRTWGPFDDKDHPGVVMQITMQRELDATGKPWRYLYSFDARRPPGDFLPVLTGEFYGAVAKGGIGKLAFRFDNLVALNMNKATDPTGPMRVFYDLTGEPRSISIDMTSAGGTLTRFDYFWAGYADGHGRFDYAFKGQDACTLSLSTWFTAEGAGKGTTHFECPLGRGDLSQCWDAQACVTYVNDPYAFTPACNGQKPCVLGAASACPPSLP